MKFALCFDVGGTDTKIGFVTRDGVLLAKDSVPTPRGGATGLVCGLTKVIDKLQTDLAAGRFVAADGTVLRAADLCATVGVAVPGIVDEPSGRAIRSANLGWDEFPMREALTAALGRPVVLGHDVRSGALGEARFGAKIRDSFFVAIGTGISAGLVLDARLVTRSGCTGEIGQILMENPDFDHPLLQTITHWDTGKANVPAMQTMERLASAEYTARRYCLLADLDPGNPNEPGGTVTSKEVFARARQGDPIAAHVVSTAVDALGTALAGVVATLGPVPIVIGGGLSKEGQPFLDRLREATANRLTNVAVPEFRLATLGSTAQLLGVGAQVFDHLDAPDSSCENEVIHA